MVLTPSAMMPLGTVAPNFKLIDVTTDVEKSLGDLKSETATVIIFMCNHCPFVKHIQTQLTEIANSYIPKGINFIAINSNDVDEFPEDSPERMKETALESGYPFPYLFDETQKVAKAYQAACTPDFYIFDQDLKCVYRGQFDDSRPGNHISPSGQDIKAALDALLAGHPVSKNQKPSIGCNIKWKD